MNNAPAYMTYFPELLQGSDEWIAARCGILTASEIKHILTPTLKVANNGGTTAHLYELLAQRITQYVEPHYISDDMLRGHDDEVYARAAYMQHIADVQDMGFIVNRRWGFPIGYSPDGLVGDDGLIECKSRRQKFQIQTIVEHVGEDAGRSIPTEYVMQAQTGLLVSERKWLDFLSYSNGLHMPVIRVFPDPVIQNAILEAAGEFERKLMKKLHSYHAALESGVRMIPTERRTIQEMY